MKNTEEVSARSNNFQAGLFSKLKGLAVPLTTYWFGKLICMPILPTR
jgi:hypothetical protein